MEIIDIIKERLSVFKNLYDDIRIVNPTGKKVLNFEKDSNQIMKGSCYELWEKNECCSNCISMRAFIENDTFVKVELAKSKLMIIITSPITIEKNIYIVEMIKDISGTSSIINDERSIYNIKNLIMEMNTLSMKD